MRFLISLCIFASFIAVVVPYKPFKSRRYALLSLIGFVVLQTIFSLSAGSTQPTLGAVSPPKATVSETPKIESATKNWSYSESKDEMTGEKSASPCSTSTNEHQFSFPYNGGSSGRLCLRNRGKRLDAYVVISSGQFLCGVEDCTLRLRFDDGPVTTFTAVESEDHRSDMFFIEPASRLAFSIKKAKQLKLEGKYYQEGRQVLQFDVAGLDWKT